MQFELEELKLLIRFIFPAHKYLSCKVTLNSYPLLKDETSDSHSLKSPMSFESEIGDEISLEFLKEMDIIMHSVFKDTIHCAKKTGSKYKKVTIYN